jgi:F-type H+-transporting ATPase subunit gamma
MSNLQDLKNRIKNIKNTSKVTKAMKVISVNKFKKAVRELESFKKNKEIIDDLINILSDNDNYQKLSTDYQKLFCKSDKISSTMFIVIASNKGLCGSFNSNLFKTIEDEIILSLKDDCNISIMTVGNKATNYFNKHNNQELLNDSYMNIQKFEAETASIAVELALQKYIKGEIDECRIYYNQYIHNITNPPRCKLLLPITISQKPYNDILSCEGRDILEKIITQYLLNKMIESLLESKASEEFARMTTMENATHNATKIYNNLILQYNRTRQACITNEISEIIGGSESLR